MANKIEADILVRGADKAKRDFKGVGDEAARAGDQIEDLGKDSKATGTEVDVLTKKTKTSADGLGDMAKEAGFLDREINRLQGSISSLTKQLDATGDTSLLKDIRKDKRQLGTFSKLAAGIAAPVVDVAASTGTSFGKALMENAGAAVKAGGPYLIGPLAVAAASAVPFLGAAIGAAVLGGVGAGGMIGGITLAAKDPRVQQAGSEFAKSAMADLQTDIGAAFSGPVIAALGQLKGTVGDLSAGIAPEMKDLTAEIGPLTRGLDALGRNALPGLNAGLNAAAPLMRTVSLHLPAIGKALGGAFDDIASGGDGAVRALDVTLTKVEDLITSTGEFVGWLGRTYDSLSSWGAGVTGDLEDILGVVGTISPFFSYLSDEMAETNDELEGSQVTLDAAGEAAGTFGGELTGVGQAAGTAAEQLDSLTTSMNKMLGITMGVQEATLGYEQAIDDLAEELADGRRTFDETTEAGRRNWNAVNDNITAINRLRDANIANGMSVGDANAIADAQLVKLDQTVAKFGKTSAEVRAYIAEIRNIPTLAQLQVTLSGVEGAKAQLLALKGLLGSSAAAANVRANADYVSGRASGGPISAGTPYIVGEEGPEPIVPGQSGTVMTTTQTKALMSGSGSSGGMAIGGGGMDIRVSWAGAGGPAGDLGQALMRMLHIEIMAQGGVVQQVLGSG